MGKPKVKEIRRDSLGRIIRPIPQNTNKNGTAGRPTVMTPETINKLEHVFMLGGSDKEACLYAEISTQTLYDYQNLHPEFVGRKEMLKETPFLKARQTIVQNLSNPQGAQWFMERKKRDEFGKSDETAPTHHTKNTYNFIFSPEVREKVRAIDGDIKKLLMQPYAKENQETLGPNEERPEGTETA